MEISDQTRKQLQALMQERNWSGFEVYYQNFIRVHFVEGSIKRATEHDTIWYAAEAEGAKKYLKMFFDGLENEAKKV